MASAGSRRTMAAGNPIFPTHLLAGAMVRGSCAATIAQVSGDSDGYYGWLAATKEARENKALVRRTLAEKVILVEAERRVDQLSDDVGAAPAEPRDDLQAASLRVDQGLHEHHPAGTRAADRKMSSDTADRSRSHPPRARHPRHRSPLLPRSHDPRRPRPQRRTAPACAEGGSKFLQRWTRTQRIRTAASMPVEALIIDHAEVPVNVRIADKAKRLRELGMSDRAIARALGVSDKTVAKAAAAVAVHGPGPLSPEGQSDDQASPLRLPSKDAPAGCGRGCPHLDGA